MTSVWPDLPILRNSTVSQTLGNCLQKYENNAFILSVFVIICNIYETDTSIYAKLDNMRTCY